jgi:signal transduction histidine kinase
MLATLLVVAARLGADPWLGPHHNRHLVFIPTVMLVSLFGGVGPGLLSAAIFTVALDYFWTGAGHAFQPPNVELVLFLVICAAIGALAESLRRARARAAAASSSREQVLNIVAHDLRNPLSTIKMTSAYLQRHPVAGDALALHLGKVDRAVALMEALIRDLVDATRFEHGGLEMVMQDEEVGSIAREAVDAFAARATASGQGLALEAGATGVVSCDRGRVLQALENLIANAVRFTPPGGQITVRVRMQEGTARFEVEDNGPGISREAVPHIFERYWTSDRHGSGLGLFIAQSVVHAHGGQIAVDTDVGRGTRFCFTLPRSLPQDKPARRIRLPTLATSTRE